MNNGNIKNAYFSNLLLLGFDPVAMENQYKIPFKENIFNVPNKKASEVILHFLFCKLCDKNVNYFSQCWPVFDQKTGSKFRSLANELITNIIKEKEIHFPNYSASLLLSPGGEKFIRVLFSLTQHVMIKIMKTKCSVKTEDMLHINMKASNFNHLAFEDSLNIASNLSIEDYLESMKLQTEGHRRWKLLSSDLQKSYWEINERISNIKHSFDSEFKDFKSELPDEDKGLKMEQLMYKYEMEILKIKNCWNEVVKLGALIKINECNFNTVFHPETSQLVLASANVHCDPNVIDIPSNFKNQALNIKDRKNVLQLTDFLKLVQILLEEMHKVISQVQIPDMSEVNNLLRYQLIEHTDHQIILENIRKELLDELLPSLRNSIDGLKQKLLKASSIETFKEISHPSASYTSSAVKSHPTMSLKCIVDDLFNDNNCQPAILVENDRFPIHYNQDNFSQEEIRGNSTPQSEEINKRCSNLTSSDELTPKQKNSVSRNFKSKVPRFSRANFENDSKKSMKISVAESIRKDESNENMSTSSSVPVMNRPVRINSEDKLADMIVEDLMNNEASIDPAIATFIENPDLAFDNTVFNSRDKLCRTPPRLESLDNLEDQKGDFNIDINVDETSFIDDISLLSLSSVQENDSNGHFDSNKNKDFDFSLIDDLSYSESILEEVDPMCTSKEVKSDSDDNLVGNNANSDCTLQTVEAGNPKLDAIIARFSSIRSKMSNNENNEDTDSEYDLTCNSNISKPKSGSRFFALDNAIFQSPP